MLQLDKQEQIGQVFKITRVHRECEKCLKFFRSDSGFYMHMERKHGGLRVPRSGLGLPCGCSFKTKWSEQRHKVRLERLEMFRKMDLLKYFRQKSALKCEKKGSSRKGHWIKDGDEKEGLSGVWHRMELNEEESHL